MIRVALFALILISIVGCDRDEPNPEARDPIYADLKAQFDRHTGVVAEEKKKLEDLRLDLAKTEPNTMELKGVRRSIAKSEHTITDSEQWALYYKIRMERRKVVDKINAREARLSSQEWPDKREYSDYQVSSRLRNADRSWTNRVPRLEDRFPNTKKEEKAEPKSEDSGE